MSAITPFWGLFGLGQSPLEISHNYCSTKCAYCFANLNSPNRKAKVKEFVNQMKNYKKSNTFTSQLLKDKMLVTMSNKTDPFALSNYKIAVPQMETLTNEGIPIKILTRGGKGIDDALSFLPKSAWYISITHTEEITRQLVEPGGSTIDERWELVDKLKSEGHSVIVACNPFSPHWVDPEDFLRRLEIHKPHGFVFQSIHLNWKQIKNMTDKERNNMGEDVLSAARKRKLTEELYQTSLYMCRGAKELGIKTLNYHHWDNDIDDVYNATYNKSQMFPTNWGFIQWCKQNKKDNDAVLFHEYAKFMLDGFKYNEKEYRIASYLTSQSEKFRNGVSIPKMRFVDLLKICWNNPHARRQLTNYECFAEVFKDDDNDPILPLDENKNSIFVFNKNNFELKYTTFTNQTGELYPEWKTKQAKAG